MRRILAFPVLYREKPRNRRVPSKRVKTIILGNIQKKFRHQQDSGVLSQKYFKILHCTSTQLCINNYTHLYSFKLHLDDRDIDVWNKCSRKQVAWIYWNLRLYKIPHYALYSSKAGIRWNVWCALFTGFQHITSLQLKRSLKDSS